MKKLCLLMVCFMAVVAVQAQTLDDDLKAKKAKLEEAAKVVSDLEADIESIESQIEIDAGWLKGYSGLLGFDFNKSSGWQANPNPDAKSTSLSIGLNGWANNIKENFFWRNNATIQKSWADVDLNGESNDVGLFDSGTVDIFNASSLAGKPLNDFIALSGLGELNTSVGGFLDPGTLDLGLGATLTPNIDDLVIVVHPLNYNFAFSGVDGLNNTSNLGLKLKANYIHDFGLVSLVSGLTSFTPYSETKQLVNGNEYGSGYYQWLNTLTFDVWNGIGVGVGFGIRNAKFESEDTQSFYTLGLSYSL